MKSPAVADTETRARLLHRLEFVMLLVMFFPVVISALFAVDDDFDGNAIVVKWSVVVAVLILNYIFFETIGKRVISKIATAINVLFMIELAAFATFLIALSLTFSEKIPLPYSLILGTDVSVLEIVFRGTLWVLMLLPLVTLSLFVFNWQYKEFVGEGSETL